MGARAGRRGLVLVAVLAVVIAACKPVVAPAPVDPPPTAATTPPPPPWCQSVPAPTAAAHVAVVDQGGSRPAVVEFQASNAAQVNQKVAQLGAQGAVLAVGQNQVVSALPASYPQGTNPNYATDQWDFQSSYVDFPGAWNATPSDTGLGVRVAVLDTGVEAAHPDLAGRVVQGKDFVLADQTKSDFGRIDGYGHGTHVAGMIAANDDINGVVGGAFSAMIVPARVLNCSGSGSTADVADAIMWAADPTGGNAKVISMSLGGTADRGNLLGTAIQYALSKNVVVVAAAGNDGAPVCDPTSNSSPNYPAAYAADQATYPGMIAVGATASPSTNPFARATYSNCNPYINVAAPGSSIYSTYAQTPTHTPAYARLSGTSMATPHVSAVAALVLSKCLPLNPTYTPAQVLVRIQTGTRAVTGFGTFAGSPVGMVDAKNATAAC